MRLVNRVLTSLGLRKHPDKTFIGRVEKGFDWLGYHLRPDGLRLAAQTLRNFAARMTRLYERESGRPEGAAGVRGQWTGCLTQRCFVRRNPSLQGLAVTCVSRRPQRPTSLSLCWC